jgi:DNA-binding transcriptional ArsR family regulator
MVKEMGIDFMGGGGKLMAKEQRSLEDMLDQCEITLVNEDMVRKAMQNQMDEDQVTHLADLFKALSDPTRIKMIHALKQGELCVCDLSTILNMGQSAVSHQLRYLRNMRLIKRRKEGKMVYYCIDDSHIGNLLTQGLEHIDHL